VSEDIPLQSRDITTVGPVSDSPPELKAGTLDKVRSTGQVSRPAIPESLSRFGLGE